MPHSALHEPLLAWYAEHARDLPWRRADATPWSVMVSEFMLQQTPVSRVLPVFEAWMHSWPSPATLAEEPPGAAVRAWGRLGYPRRALRLHAAATAIRDEHGGEVPGDYDALRKLPGIGDYTAAAVASFAFGRRHVVLDTNVRRVLGRALTGTQYPAKAVTPTDRALGASVLPDDARRASRWAVATMELGALVCTARSPACQRCPVRDRCAWRLAGYPDHDGPPRRGQTYAGTDRQCRGRLLAVLRDSHDPVHRSRLEQAWDDELQRERALDGLVADGLVEPVEDDLFALPA
jgi:A/G-specific adenine glycosylase